MSCFQCGAPGMHTPMTQLFVVQSKALWQGKAHLPYCVLHLWVPQLASL
jgi:hypothetical protein